MVTGSDERGKCFKEGIARILQVQFFKSVVLRDVWLKVDNFRVLSIRNRYLTKFNNIRIWYRKYLGFYYFTIFMIRFWCILTATNSFLRSMYEKKQEYAGWSSLPFTQLSGFSQVLLSWPTPTQHAGKRSKARKFCMIITLTFEAS